jgi:hypothetical protein
MEITLSIPVNPKKGNVEIAKILRDLADAFSTTPPITTNKTVETTEELPTDAPIEYTFDQITEQFKKYAGAYGREAAVKILNTFKVKKVADLKSEVYPNVMKALGA